MSATRILRSICALIVLVPGCAGSKPGSVQPPPDKPPIQLPPYIPKGGFTVVPNALPRGTEPGISSLGDCDNDGLLDVLRPQDGVILIAKPDGTFQSQSVGPALQRAMLQEVTGDSLLDLVIAGIGIRQGKGECAFEEVRRPFKSYGLALAVRVQDVNGDGLDDIIESLTGAPGTPPFVIRLARGDGDFDDIPLKGAGFGTAATTGLPVFNSFFHDVDGDGVMDGFFLSDQLTSWFSWGVAGEKPTFAGDERLTSILAPANPMSMAVFDTDRDGHLDYFFSGAAGGNILFRGGVGRALQNSAEATNLRGEIEGRVESWTSAAFDADLDGWMDLLVLRKPLNLAPEDLTQQPDRPNLFVSQRDGKFLDVAGNLDLAKVEGISMTCGDLRGDGRISCIVDGNTTTTLVQNQFEQTNPWVGLRLRGTISGVSAAGSIVSVDGAQPPRIYLAGVQTGTYTTHAPDLVIAADPVTNITVTWPSGVKQKVEALPPSRYTSIREPEVFQLTRRVARADGTSTVDVVLRPQLAGAREATVVRIGAGEWSGPSTTQPDGSIKRTLVAPMSRGITTLQVALDGEPMKVRPRILFE